MTEAKRQQYTKIFKRDVVCLVTEQGDAIAKVARSHGSNASMLVCWMREDETQSTHAFPGQGHQTPEQEEHPSCANEWLAVA